MQQNIGGKYNPEATIITAMQEKGGKQNTHLNLSHFPTTNNRRGRKKKTNTKRSTEVGWWKGGAADRSCRILRRRKQNLGLPCVVPKMDSFSLTDEERRDEAAAHIGRRGFGNYWSIQFSELAPFSPHIIFYYILIYLSGLCIIHIYI